jgi:hypothetical protein
LATSKAAAAAYPGTMVVYAAVPTTGLPATDAKDYASLLQFAATSGQDPGLGVGQLPPGYLPMTNASGLGALASYTQAAAKDVAAQNGEVPPMTTKRSTGGTHPPPTTVPTTTTTAGTSPSGTTPTSAGSTGSTTPTTTVARHHHTPPPGVIASLGNTLAIDLGSGGVLVVLILGLALLGLLGVPTTYVIGRRRGRW